jgi:hypothetical protein
LFRTTLLLVQVTLSGGDGLSTDEHPAIGQPVHPGPGLEAVEAKARGAPDEELQALVLQLSGTARLERDGNPTRELRLGDVLMAGDRVLPENGASALLLLRDGSTVPVDGTVEVPLQEGDPGAVFARTSDLLLRFGARTPAEPPQGDPEDAPLPRAAAPANGIPVRILTPTLHWRPAPDSERYRVTLQGLDGEVRAFEVEGDSLAMVPPELALSPGGAYEWSVAALPLGEPAPQLRFRVLDREGMDRVAGGLRELREAGLDPEGVGSLPALALFQELDLIYDAWVALDRLIGPGELPVNPALTTLRSHLRLAIRPVYLTPEPPSEESLGSGTRR